MRRTLAPALPLTALLLMALLTGALLNSVVNTKVRQPPGSAVLVRPPQCVGLHPAPADKTGFSAWGFSELRSRMTWGVSILFAALAIGVTFVTALVIMDGEHTWSRGWLVWLFLLVPLLLYLPTSRNSAWVFNADLLGCTAYNGTGASRFVTWTETLAHSTLIMLAIAVGFVLSRTVRDPIVEGATEEQAMHAAAKLARRQSHVRLLLYMGAVALVAGTVEVTALYGWAASLTDTKLHFGADASVIPETMGALSGSFYSLLLAAIFLPAFVILRSSAEQLADKAKNGKPAAERSTWMAANAIESSFPKKLLSVLAVLAPLIAGGPATKLLEAITQ
jgi:hypothetical protein